MKCRTRLPDLLLCLIAAPCLPGAAVAAAQAAPPPAAQREDLQRRVATQQVVIALAEISTTADGEDRQSARAAAEVLRAQRDRLDIGESRFQALLEQTRVAAQAQQEFNAAQLKQLCSRRDELTTIQKLAAALDAMERQALARFDESLPAVLEVLGPERKVAFDAIVEDVRGRISTSASGTAGEQLIASGVKLEAVLPYVCERAADPAAP